MGIVLADEEPQADRLLTGHCREQNGFALMGEGALPVELSGAPMEGGGDIALDGIRIRCDDEKALLNAEVIDHHVNKQGFDDEPQNGEEPRFHTEGHAGAQGDEDIRLDSSAMPIFREVYFLRIMATMSVPPLEASRLKRMAEPTAGSPTAKRSSISGWEVSGAERGITISSPRRRKDISRDEYTVRMPKLLPNTRKAMISRSTLITVTKVPGVMPGI